MYTRKSVNILLLAFLFLGCFPVILSSYEDEASRLYDEGYDYSRHRLYGKALESFNKSISINPNDGRAYFPRGKVYYNLSKFEEAIGDLDKAITLDHHNAEYFFLRGKCFSELYQWDRSIEDFTEAMRLAAT